jgi:hypothetical protein
MSLQKERTEKGAMQKELERAKLEAAHTGDNVGGIRRFQSECVDRHTPWLPSAEPPQENAELAGALKKV